MYFDNRHSIPTTDDNLPISKLLGIFNLKFLKQRVEPLLTNINTFAEELASTVIKFFTLFLRSIMMLSHCNLMFVFPEEGIKHFKY